MDTFTRWGYEFKGCYTTSDKLQPKAGVYVIWCKKGEKWSVLDVGESANINERLANHERKPCWERNCDGIIYYSATYTPNLQQSGRIEIEQKIRSLEKPPCGEK